MRTLLFLHLLGAAIWVGGHLVLALGILPGALRRRDPQAIRAFEQVYERIGIPALLLQVVSGLWLASLWLPFDHWFGATPVARALQLKLLLLAATAALTRAGPGAPAYTRRSCSPPFSSSKSEVKTSSTQKDVVAFNTSVVKSLPT